MRGNGRLITIRGAIPENLLGAVPQLTLELDSKHYLIGNVFLINKKRYVICHREPEEPQPGQQVVMQLRPDGSTRAQRQRNSKNHRRWSA